MSEDHILSVIVVVVALLAIFFGTMAYTRSKCAVCKCGSTEFEYAGGVGAACRICKKCGVTQ